MNRFFIKTPILNRITITGDDVNHIQNVLRLKTGDSVIICDGAGSESVSVIRSIEKDRIICESTEIREAASEPSVLVTLFQGVPKSSKMDTIIEKCVELGVHEIVPMLTERCVIQPKDSFSHKIERWQRISEAASKQSRRGIVPTVRPVQSLKDISFQRFQTAIVAYELERTATLKEALKEAKGKEIALIVGPEGGFSPDEISALTCAGVQPVSLGPRILRTETAGMAMLAQVMYEFEY